MRAVKLEKISISGFVILLEVLRVCLLVQSHTIYLKLLEYGNPTDRRQKGQPCDKDSLCDPRFIICMGIDCSILSGNTPKGYFIDKTHILFEDTFGEKKNLYSAQLDDNRPLPDPIFLNVMVHDDEYDWKVIGYFQDNLQSPGIYNISFREKGQSGFLRVHFWYTCGDARYGPRCAQYCKPSKDTASRYGCHNGTGEHICEKGYSSQKSSRDRTCESRTPCLPISPCNFSSECNEKPPSSVDERPYRCSCPKHLTGKHCENVRSPCPQEVCLNGGKCWLNDEKEYRCECPPQFKGKLCEEPAWKDEASILQQCQTAMGNENCLNNGLCLPYPIVSTSMCFCPRGFGGDRCELNITWRETYDEIQLWRDIVQSYTQVVLATRPSSTFTVSGHAVVVETHTEYLVTENENPLNLEKLWIPWWIILASIFLIAPLLIFAAIIGHRRLNKQRKIIEEMNAFEEDVHLPTVVYKVRNVSYATDAQKPRSEYSENAYEFA